MTKQIEKEKTIEIEERQVSCLSCASLRQQLISISNTGLLRFVCMNCGLSQFVDLQMPVTEPPQSKPIEKRHLDYLG